MSGIHRPAATLLVVLMLTTLGTPLIGATKADTGSARGVFPSDNSSTPVNAPSAEETTLQKPPAPFHETPKGMVSVANDWPQPTRLSFAPWLSNDTRNHTLFKTDKGTFIFGANSPWAELGVDGKTFSSTFTALSNGILADEGLPVVSNSMDQVSISYPLLDSGVEIGTMRVMYKFSGQGNKITANFTAVPTLGTHSVVWLVVTDAGSVRTTDMTSYTVPGTIAFPGSATRFDRLQGSIGCYYGGCLDVNGDQFSSLGDVGDDRVLVATSDMRIGDDVIAIDYSDAASVASGAYAISDFQYDGKQGHAVAVPFSSDVVDPSLVTSPGHIGSTGQRNTFFDGQVYWAFWRTNSGTISYTYSADGLNWNNPTMTDMPQGGGVAPTGIAAVSYGKTVAVLWTSSDDKRIMMEPGVIVGVGTIQWTAASPVTICDLTVVASCYDGVTTELFADGSTILPPSAVFMPNGMLAVTAISHDTQHNPTKNVVRLLWFPCRSWGTGCADAISWMAIVNPAQTQKWSFAVPFVFGSASPILGVMYANENSQLQIIESWQLHWEGGSGNVYCNAQIDWGNNHGALPTYGVSGYIASTISAVDGLADIYLSYINDNKIVHFRIKPSSTSGTCDQISESYNVYAGLYPASHLSAGSETGSSGEYLVWTNATSSSDQGQTINDARVVPDFGATVETPSWAWNGGIKIPVQELTVAPFSSRFISVAIGDTSANLYFATSLLASDAFGPANPWQQVLGAPSVYDSGTEFNPATGLVRRADPLYSVPSVRESLSVSQIYREPGVFSTGNAAVHFYRPPADYGYIWDLTQATPRAPVIQLDLPWIDTGGNEILHVQGGQAYVISWNAPGLTKWFNNSLGDFRFHLKYDSTSLVYTLYLANGGQYLFDSNGRITKVSSDYDSVQDNLGITFTYTSGRLTSINDVLSTSVGGVATVRSLRVHYVGTSAQVSYIDTESSVTVAQWSYATKDATCTAGTAADSADITVTTIDGTGTTYHICQSLLTRVDLPTTGSASYTYGVAVPQGSEYHSSPLTKMVVYNETTTKVARTVSIGYHYRNGDIMVAERRVYDSLGALVGEKEYLFRPGIGKTMERDLDFSGLRVWYDMSTMGDGVSCATGLLNDQSGSGYCGTLSGTAAKDGRFDPGLYFNGASAIKTPLGSPLPLYYNLTFAAWVRRDSGQSDPVATVISNDRAGRLEVTSAGIVKFEYSDGTTWWPTATPTAIASGAWTHISATMELPMTKCGSFAPLTYALIAIYLNGAQSTTQCLQHLPVSSSRTYSSFGDDGSSTMRFKGTIDETQIWSRSLNANEALSLYRENPESVQRGSLNFWYDSNNMIASVDETLGENTAPSASSEVALDNWGNVIYSRDALGHESFESYANTNHQYQFYAPGRIVKDDPPSMTPYITGFDTYTDDFAVLSGSPQRAFSDDAPQFSPSVQITPSVTTENKLQLAPNIYFGAFEAYVKLSVASSSDTNKLFTLSMPDSRGQYVAGVRFDYDGTLRFTGIPNDVYGDTCYWDNNPSSGIATYSANKWMRVDMTYDGGTKFDVYINGRRACGSISFTERQYLPSKLWVRLQYSTQSFVAYIDDIKMLNEEQLDVEHGPNVPDQGIAFDQQMVDVYQADGTYITSGIYPSGGIGDMYIDMMSADRNHLASLGPYIVSVRSPDDQVEYTTPYKNIYGGDIIRYAYPRTFDDRLFRTRSGFGRWSTMLVDDTRPGAVCDQLTQNSGGPVPFADFAWTANGAGPAVSGYYSHTTGTDLFTPAETEHCTYLPTVDTPAASDFYVQYVYFPGGLSAQGFQAPLEVGLTVGDTYWGRKGATWGTDVLTYPSQYRYHYMGPLPPRLNSWIKLIAHVDDFRGGPGIDHAQGPISSVSYITSGGMAYWDATARSDSSESKVEIDGLPHDTDTVYVKWAGNGTVINSAHPSQGIATIDMYPKISAFPATVTFEFDDSNLNMYYAGNPTTIWGGDVFKYVPPYGSDESPFYSSWPSILPWPYIHSALLGRKALFGDCQDAKLCLDMESATNTPDMTHGQLNGVVNAKLLDLSGNGNHAIMPFSSGIPWAVVSYVSSVPNTASGQALFFNAVGQPMMEVPDNPTVRYSASLSASAWINIPTILAASTILSKGSSSQWEYELSLQSGTLQAIIFTPTAGIYAEAYSSSGAIQANTLYQVGFTFQAGTALKLYINGAVCWATTCTVTSFSGTPATGTYPLVIGAEYPGNVDVFYGLIDQVMLFQRTLSANDMLALYRSAAPNAKQVFNNIALDGNILESRVADYARQMKIDYTHDVYGHVITSQVGSETYTDRYATLYGNAYRTYARRDADSQVTRYSYDPAQGDVLGTLTPDCKRMRTEYDYANRPVRTLYYDSDTSLKAYYDMETVDTVDNAGGWLVKDMTCSGIDLGFGTSPGVGVYVTGRQGKAFLFDGWSMHATSSATISMSLPTTLGAWVNQGTSQSGDGRVVSTHTTGGVDSYNLIVTSDGHVKGQFPTAALSSAKFPSANTGTTTDCAGNGSPSSDNGDWASPINADVTDSIYATAAPAVGTGLTCNDWSGYGFSLPSTARITRVLVQVKAHVANTPQTVAPRLNVGLIEVPQIGDPFNCAVQTASPPYPWDTTLSFDFTGCKNWSYTDFTAGLVKTDVGAWIPSGGVANTFDVDSVSVFVTYYNLFAAGSVGTVVPGTWAHIAAAFVSSPPNTQVNIYINGNLDSGSALLSGVPVAGASYVAVGGAYSGGTYFKGTIDEVQVFAADKSGSIIRIRDLTYNLLSVTEKTYDTTGTLSTTDYSTTSTMMPSIGKRGLYYDMDTTVPTGALEDLSGNGLDGAISGTSPIAGKIGNARSFGNVGDWINAGDPMTSRQPMTALTINTWVKTSGTTKMWVVAKSPDTLSASGTHYALAAYDATYLHPYMIIGDGTGTGVYAAPSINLNDGAWHMLTAVWDGWQVTFYKDGAADPSGSLLTTQRSINTRAGTQLVVGQSSDMTNLDRFSGSIDELQIIPRALSSSEVTNLYGGYQGTGATDTTTIYATYIDGLGRSVRGVTRDVYGKKLATAAKIGWNDRPLTKYLPTGQYETLTYDFLGRVLTDTTPGNPNAKSGVAVQTFLDASLKVQSTGATGERGYTTQDMRGRMIESGQLDPVDGAYNKTKFTYNAIGLPITASLIDHLGNTMSTINTYYDTLGRSVFAVYPDSSSSSTAYDGLGRKSQFIDRAGRLTIYLYDAENRFSEVRRYNSVSTSQYFSVFYAYYANTDLVWTVTNGTSGDPISVKTIFGYNSLHQRTSEETDIPATSPVSTLTAQYVFDAAGKLLSVSYPLSKSATYGYDTFGRLSSISFGATGSETKYADITYDPYNRLQSVALSDAGTSTGITESLAYDARDRPTQIKLSSSTSTYMQLDYSAYDLSSRIASAGDDMGAGGGSKSVTYSYDGNGRLSKATGPWGASETSATQKFTSYDLVGNLLSKTDTDGTVYDYVYNTGCGGDWSALCTVKNDASGANLYTFTYNSAGSAATRKTWSGGAVTATRTFTYDFAQQLMKIAGSTDNTYTSTYTEDGLDQRVKTVEATASTNTAYYAYSNGALLYNTTSGSGTASWYIYLGSRVLFRFDGATAHFYQYDSSGNVRIVWRYSGGYVAEARYRYEPFGEQVAITPVTQEFRMRFGAGAQYDSSTGFYKMGPRYYDAWVGRFLSRDPILAHGYVYARDNPVSYVDPGGLDSEREPPPIPPWLFEVPPEDFTRLPGLNGELGFLGVTEPIPIGEIPELNEVPPASVTSDAEGNLVREIVGLGEVSGVPTNPLPNDALVVRGGLNEPETLDAALLKGGISARSAPGMTVEQLAEGLPHPNIGVTTVGDIRAFGGDVIPSYEVDNPFHVTIIPGSGGTQELSGLFEIQPNPWVSP